MVQPPSMAAAVPPQLKVGVRTLEAQGGVVKGLSRIGGGGYMDSLTISS